MIELAKPKNLSKSRFAYLMSALLMVYVLQGCGAEPQTGTDRGEKAAGTSPTKGEQSRPVTTTAANRSDAQVSPRRDTC